MKKYSAEEVYPKSQLGKCMVYFNMSHHYRRIYSAKPRVDTNLKKSSPSFCCSSPDVFNFVRRSCIKQPIISTPRHRTCAKEEEEPKTYKPRILESRAESKLRSLPVYQPPQKVVIKKPVQTAEHPEVQVNIQESRDHEKKVEDINLKSDKAPKKDNKENSPKNENRRESNFEKQINERDKEERLRPLDKSTVMFLKDITDDILQKGIYTNKSLEKLFSYHISKNKYSLPKELMEQEVRRLKMELEMPIEEEKFGSESSVEDDEVLSALDSLLLPADIRDQVASSLGLKLKPPPLPSPKDSFTGSLALTSMSDVIDKEEDKSIGTFTMKSKPKETKSKEITNSGKTSTESNNKLVKDHQSSDKTTSEISQKVVSDDDKTIADEDYSEEVVSEKKSNTSEEQASNISEVQSEEIKHEETNSRETKHEELISEEKNNSSEIKSDKKDSLETKDVKDDMKDNGDSSDLSSIHTESDS